MRSVPAQVTWPTSWGELLTEYPRLVGAFAAFVAAFAVVYLLGRLVVVPLSTRAMTARGFDETIRSLVRNALQAFTFFAALAIAFAVAGFGSFLAAFATLGGALALAIGIASQDLIGNLVAGVFILKDRPFSIGDWIKWTDGEGRVEEIDLRVTTVRTFDNEKITVPNGDLANNPVTNPVAYDRLRQSFVFGIGYDDDIDRAREIILEEADRIEGILDDPAPDIRVTELADSYVGLKTRFWIPAPNRSDFVAVRSALVQSVKERCDAEGIDIPFPQRQVTGSVDVDVGERDAGSESAT